MIHTDLTPTKKRGSGGDKFISHIFTIFHLLTSIFEFKKIHYVKYDQKALLSIQIGLQNTFWFKKIMIIG